MRLASFIPPPGFATPPGDGVADPAPRTGVVTTEGATLVDLTDPSVGLPGDMAALLQAGPNALEAARAAPRSSARRFALGEVRLLAPVPVPPKFLAIGMNYRAHVAEMGREPPAHQYWFNKQRTCVVGPGHPIVVPTVSEQVDYEGELGVVIGRRAKGVPASRWSEVVAGFTVVNDVSVRDFQALSPTFTLGKSFDTHGPTGPFVVSVDEIGDPSALGVRTWVNTELRQDSSTADLIFTIPEMIECLTTAFTLEPGDILATGTPSGVGAGSSPPRWLRPGDTVRIAVEGVGDLENPVEAEVA
ncbi:MAG: fumarylacetoacetate hydrolase family protein [Actinomycetota bacterium]|nr:fumarylacetoacetate hydrolase family protein [Actinomycetota bacterium]